MSITDIYDHPLLKLPKYGSGTGLHRVDYLMDAVGIDRTVLSARAIVVTGSNGKGSTAKISSELLRAAGGKVGLFTSPHLYRYNERFQIDGVPVHDDALISALDIVHRAVEAYRTTHDDAIGAFEAQFVVALLHFQRSAVDWMVLEAGIGGRFDPVRFAAAPVTALVSLDLEHTELLGDTLLEIACDKLDATPPGGTAILGESCLPLEAELRAHAEYAEIALEFVQPDGWRDGGCRDGWQYFEIDGPGAPSGELKSRLVGRHQINNHAVAFALCRHRLGYSLDVPWRDAAEHVFWPGRLERVHDAPAVYVDVGHTPAGIETALDGFRALTGGQPAILVTGGSKNKHVREMLELLVPYFDRVVCTAAYHNGLAAEAVAGFARDINSLADVTCYRTMEEAAAVALRVGEKLDRPVYVAGGLFLAIEFAETCRGNNPRALHFF
jgi:dihydrofolate synthase/folylpolyglutamate synthase